MAAADDSAILASARAEARILVTADLDFPRLLSRASLSSPSVILFRGGDWSEQDIEARMTVVLELEGSFESTCIVVERSRIRRRKLPLMS